ncbi:unnamed protein product [Diamesa serratosioi]
MVLSKMYCAEQIVIPDTISNILKTYAKAALKTQPYDLLRWSAAYFRCISLDVMPPVKPRYEQENTFGSLTKGYVKVLLSQLGKGYFIRRDILEHRWNGLCLPEDEFLKFLTLSRMLYWPQVHWLKLVVVMIGSINENFFNTVNMLCELLTDEPEGGSSPVPLWLFRECFKYIAELDCSDEQTFFDGKKVLTDGVLENETKMPNLPRKLSSISFKNAIIDYWKYRIENSQQDIFKGSKSNSVDECEQQDVKASVHFEEHLCRSGSQIEFIGDAHEIIKNSQDFDSVIVVLKQLKCESTFEPQYHISEKQYARAEQRDFDVAEMREQMSQTNAQGSKKFLEQECCNLLQDIGPPWNWLHNFATQNCREKSYNFLEQGSIKSDITLGNSSDDSFDYVEEKFLSRRTSTGTVHDECKTIASDTTISIQPVDDDDDETPTNEHKVLVETICSISDAYDNGDCEITDIVSVGSILDEQHAKKVLQTLDYKRLKGFIDKAEENNLVFNDLNELYNYFIHESCQEKLSENLEIRDDDVVDQIEINKTSSSNVMKDDMKVIDEEDDKNVVSIFGESGIDVDGKLLGTKVNERMILGLVVHQETDENLAIVSDIASVSSASMLETVKFNKNVTKEKTIQTIPYKDQIHEKRIRSKLGKSKSATSIKRQPFTCKIPQLPGISHSMDPAKLEHILKFLTHRSFEQGGFIYPRNFLEDECPNMMD